MNLTSIANLCLPPLVSNWIRAPRERERRPSELPRVPFLLPDRKLEDIFPGADLVEVTLLPRQLRRHLWAMPENEILVLGALCRILAPRIVVEFGTFTGASTLAIAANSPSDSRIVTIDVDPQQRSSHVHGQGIGIADFCVGELFHATRFARNIEQRFVNSQELDDTSLLHMVDLVFVDADHTYEFVKRDTATAQRLLRPGGVILWHDYTWDEESSECAGVTRCVNEFSQAVGNCFRIESTRFAIHLANSDG